jgi:hypothetical protein
MCINQMSDILSILTPEQKQKLSLDQLNRIMMSDDNEFEILVSNFNSKLCKLLNELDYCQHDSEYRVFYDDSLDAEKKALIADLNKILHDCPDFVSRVYIYSTGYYELTEYHNIGENR